MKTITYRNNGIDYNFYGRGEYTVQFCGDDILFQTLEEAKQFIDEMIASGEMYED